MMIIILLVSVKARRSNAGRALWVLSGLLLVACAAPPSVPAQQTIPVGNEPSEMVIADWNNDGFPDLAVAAGADQVAILMGQPGGRFGSARHVPAGSYPGGLSAADLDGDGWCDLVVANHETDYVSIYRGDGRGGFAPFPTSRIRPGFSPHPHTTQAADIDRDGHIDLLVDHRDAGGILLLRGDGTGRFVHPPVLIDMGGDPYRGMALGDLNEDGWVDLVTPNPNEVGVALNEKGVMRPTQPIPATSPFTVALGDMNGDGHLDLLTSAESGPTEIRFGTGDGRFSSTPDWIEHWGRGARNSAVGDFNADGIDDAVVASYFTSSVMVVFGGREGLSTAQLEVGTNPWGLAVADLNSDGSDDLVVSDTGAGTVSVFLNVSRD